MKQSFVRVKLGKARALLRWRASTWNVSNMFYHIHHLEYIVFVALRYVRTFGRYVTFEPINIMLSNDQWSLQWIHLLYIYVTFSTVQYSNVMYMTLQYVAATFYVTQHCFCYSPTISSISPSQVMHWLGFKFVPIAILLFATTKSIMAYMEEYMWWALFGL